MHAGFERIAPELKTSNQISSWRRILQLLLSTVKLCPQASAVQNAPAAASSVESSSSSSCLWSDLSELWFLAMQGDWFTVRSCIFCCIGASLRMFYYPSFKLPVCHIKTLLISFPLELTALVASSQTFKDGLVHTVSQISVVQEFTDVLKVFVELQESNFCSYLSSVLSSYDYSSRLCTTSLLISSYHTLITLICRWWGVPVHLNVNMFPLIISNSFTLIMWITMILNSFEE